MAAPDVSAPCPEKERFDLGCPLDAEQTEIVLGRLSALVALDNMRLRPAATAGLLVARHHELVDELAALGILEADYVRRATISNCKAVPELAELLEPTTLQVGGLLLTANACGKHKSVSYKAQLQVAKDADYQRWRERQAVLRDKLSLRQSFDFAADRIELGILCDDNPQAVEDMVFRDRLPAQIVLGAVDILPRDSSSG